MVENAGNGGDVALTVEPKPEPVARLGELLPERNEVFKIVRLAGHVSIGEEVNVLYGVRNAGTLNGLSGDDGENVSKLFLFPIPMEVGRD